MDINDKKTAVKFVKTWQQATDVKQVADLMKVPKEECSRIAALLRKKGVPLKRFKGFQRYQLDIEELITTAKETT